MDVNYLLIFVIWREMDLRIRKAFIDEVVITSCESCMQLLR